jgi:hypothetical protein
MLRLYVFLYQHVGADPGVRPFLFFLTGTLPSHFLAAKGGPYEYMINT